MSERKKPYTLAEARRRVREAQRFDAAQMQLLDMPELQQNPEDRAEDALVNFLGDPMDGQLFREIEKVAVYVCDKPPTKEEVDDLYVYRTFCELAEDIAHARTIGAQAVMSGKVRAGRKDPLRRTDAALEAFVSKAERPGVLRALRTAERRACYHHVDGPLEELMAALLILRHVIDLVEGLNSAEMKARELAC